MKVALFLFFILFSVNRPFAQTTLPGTAAGRASLNVYFDRADRAADLSGWLREAEQGLALALPAEREAYLAELMLRLGERMKLEAETRMPAGGLYGLVEAIAAADKSWRFETEAGAIRFDAAGDPVFRGETDLEAEAGQWEAAVRGRAEELLGQWEDKARATCDELAAAAGEYRAAVAPKLTASVAQVRERVRNEYERLIAEGRHRLAVSRLKDSFSLRRKTEAETAGQVADDLIGTTAAELEGRRAELAAGLSYIGSLPGEDIRIALEDWQDSFRREFEAGMQRWTAAEQRCFEQRIAWETDAAASYREGEAAWDAAMARFSAVREAWAVSMNATIEQGRAAWDRCSQVFLDDFRAAMQQVTEGAERERARFSADARGLLNVFRQSRGVVELSERNYDYLNSEAARLTARRDALQASLNGYQAARGSLLGQREAAIRARYLAGYLGRPTGFEDPTISANPDGGSGGVFWYPFWGEGSPNALYRRQLIWADDGDGHLSQIEGYVPVDANSLPLPNGFREWAAVVMPEVQRLDAQLAEIEPQLVKYRDQAARAAEELVTIGTERDYWMRTRGEYLTSCSELENAMLALETEAADYDPDLPASSLEEERQRLAARIELLERQIAVARRVAEYARDRSAGRATEAQSRTARELSRAAFDQAQAAYQASIKAMSGLSSAMDAGQAALAECGTRLDAAQGEYQEARRAYESALQIWIVQDSSVLESVIAEYGRNLDEFYADGREAVWQAYAANWEDWRRADFAHDADAAARAIRDGSAEEPALAVSQARSEALAGAAIDWIANESAVEYSARLLSLGAQAVWDEHAAALAAYETALSAGDGRSRARAEHALARLAGRAAREARYGQTLVRLFEAGWDDEAVKSEARSAPAAEEKAWAAYHLARARVQAGALAVRLGILAEDEVESGAAGLSRLFAGPLAAGEREALEAELAGLESLIAKLVQSAAGALNLSEAAATDGGLAAFLAGAGSFSADGFDYSACFASDERGAAESASTVRQIWNEYGASSRALFAEKRKARELEVLLQRVSVTDGDGSTVTSFLALGGLASPEAGRDLFAQLEPIQVPEYVLDALLRYVGHVLRTAGASAPAAPPAGTELSFADRCLQAAFGLASERRLGDAREEASLRGILDLTLARYRGAAFAAGGTQEAAYQARRAALAAEERIDGTFAARVGMETKLTAVSRNREQYYSDNVNPARETLDAAELLVANEQAGWRTALAAFEEASAAYRTGRTAFARAHAVQQAAAAELQAAEEVLEFASGGYELAGLNPEGILAERQAAQARLGQVLSVITAMNPGGIGDAGLAEALSDQASMRRAEAYVLAVKQSLDAKAASLNGELGRQRSNLVDQVGAVFAFKDGLNFQDVPGRNASLAEMSDFSGKSNAELAARAKAYFELTDKKSLSDIYSRDTALWTLDLARRGNGVELLRLFGLAFWYEFGNQYGTANISILSDQNFRNLNGKGGIAFDVNAELNSAGWSHLSWIQNNSDNGIKKLYSFFKAMRMTDHTCMDLAFIGKDLSKILHERMVQRTNDKINGVKSNWWSGFWNNFTGETNALENLRNNMANVTGDGERAAVAAAGGKALAAINSYYTTSDARDALLGQSGAAPTTYANFKTSAAGLGIAGLGLDAAADARLGQWFENLNAEQKASNLRAAEGLLGAASAEESSAARRIAARAAALESGRAAARDAYLALFGTANWDAAAAAAAAQALYGPGTYQPESLIAALVGGARGIPTTSLAVRERRLEELAGALATLYGATMDAAVRREEDRLGRQYEELVARRDLWERKTGELFATGALEWRAAAVKLAGNRAAWREEYRREYEKRAASWELKYELLATKRGEWVTKATKSAVNTGNAALSRELGIEEERLMSEAESISIPELKTARVDLDGVAAEALGSGGFRALLAEAGRLAGKAGGERIAVAACLPGGRGANAAMKLARSFADSLTGEIEKHASLATALQMKQAVGETEQAIEAQLGQANRSVEKGLADTLEGVGYRREGGWFSRRAIIDSTLFGGIENETQSVEAYKYFNAPDFQTGVDLSRRGLEGLTAELIQAKVKKAVNALSSYMELLFGRKDGAGKTAKKKLVGNEFAAYFDRQLEAWKAGARYASEGTNTDGLFNFHVGYAPVMRSDRPEEVGQPGYGEAGRIMALYFRNEARLGRGLAALDQPWYDRRMWDDDPDNDGKPDGLIGAPTTRSVGSIAVSVGAGLLTGGMGMMGMIASAGLNLVDDAAFMAADMAGGRMSWDRGWENLGRQAVIGVGSSLIGGVFENGLSKIAGDGVLASLLAKNLELGTQNAFSGAVNSLSWDGSGFGFDFNRFTESTIGEGALISYAGGAAGAATASGLGMLNMVDGNGLRLNGRIFGTDSIQAFNRLAGGLSTAAVNYGLAGQTKVNVLNFDTLGLKALDGKSAVSNGLLELNLGGDDPLFTLGMGGTDLNLGLIAGSVAGLADTLKIAGMKAGSLLGDQKGHSTLNAANMLGYTRSAWNHTVGQDIWSGKLAVDYGDLAAGEYGMYNRNKNQVTLSRTLLGGGKEEAAQLATVMSHEGTHYQENRVEALAHEAGMQTYSELSKIFELGGRGGFYEQMVEVYLNPESWKENTGEADYWRKKIDGTLVNNGEARLTEEVYNPDGTIGTRIVPGSENEKSISEALVHYLGRERTAAMLKNDPQDINNFDAQTLVDVLKVSPEMAVAMKNNPVFADKVLGRANQAQIDKLMGEALMKNAGIAWNDSSGWTGQGNGIAFSDNRFALGEIGIRRLGNGSYEKFTVSAEAVRDADAFQALQWNENKWQENFDFARNTSIDFVKKDLNGKTLERYDTGTKWNTVDIGYGQIAGTVDQHMYSFDLGDVQGNTVNSNSYIRLIDYKSQKYGVDKIFQISNAETIAGSHIGISGTTPSDSARWLWHPTGYGRNDGCWTTMNDVGFTLPSNYLDDPADAWRKATLPGSGAYNFQRVTNYLQNRWGVYKGLNMQVSLLHQNPRNGTNWRW